nr:hypothetical protein [uncultured Flavobacterium sp.]
MKNLTGQILCFLICAFSPIALTAQVGVGTTTPKAALDVNSTTTGFLMPRVILTATNVAAPVINPQGGLLEMGTMVFNTNTTAGTYGVSPGPYFWDGARWVSQFHKSFEKYNKQTANLTVAKSATVFTDIPGLTGLTFTAPYDGVYQFTFTGYLGAETPATTISFSTNYFGWVEGQFKLTVNGVDYYKYQHATSFNNSTTSQQYLQLFNECNMINRITLSAGQTCTINASYRGDNTDGYTNNNTIAAHYVGKSAATLGNECEVSVVYLGR